ncbi:hypothetical protein ZIOFF_038702 [Zingiber officinale]|uniref:Vesicle-fusing ATPase n=1 Tax=Zingiber officinale TaxID=94328 RepID=A0A8J5GA55_ZINOF|nr:hypothetical protein ZIOFF_038702 [Zingiber officinale]
MTTGEAAASPKVGIAFSNRLRHMESLSLHPSGAGQISHLNAVILGSSFVGHSVVFISFDDLTKPLDEESIKVTMIDFLNALHEVGPAFGASMDDLERRRLNGIINCGPTGSGKTSMAATIGIESDFPYVKMVSCDIIDEIKILTSDEDGLLGFDVHSDGHGQRQLTVLARDERMEITSSMNGAPLLLRLKTSSR